MHLWPSKNYLIYKGSNISLSIYLIKYSSFQRSDSTLIFTMELAEIPDLLPSRPTVPPLFSACVSSVLRNKLAIKHLPANIKQTIKNLRNAPGIYYRKSFVLHEDNHTDFLSILADKQLEVSQSENFGQWNIQSHPGPVLWIGWKVDTTFSISIPTNGGTVDSYITGPLYGPIDSCYYTWNSIYFHGVNRSDDEEDEIWSRYSLDFQFVDLTPTCPSQMIVTIRYVNVEDETHRNPEISIAKVKYERQWRSSFL